MSPTTTDKACPIVLRASANGRVDLLVFRHPLAGHQLIKGSIEPGEARPAAAIRELTEESGLVSVEPQHLLAPFRITVPLTNGQTVDQRWHPAICRILPSPGALGGPAATLPARWTHWTADGGGLLFELLWWPLEAGLDARWHPLFHLAMQHIRSQLHSVHS